MNDAAPQLTVDQARWMVAGGCQLLDVREPYEWEAGHAPQATHIPMGQLASTWLPRWTKHRVIVLCRSGSRAADAVRILRSRGVEAFAVSGGMNAWREAGGPVVSSGGAPGLVA